MGSLFGTDGIRGVANTELTPILAFRLGRAAGELLGGPGRTFVVGQDTRRSGDMFVAALAAGLASTGTDVVRLGVVTTPCLAFATQESDHAGGIMVSASHNPAADNGLKVIVRGRKADDALEEALERAMSDDASTFTVGNDDLGRETFDASVVKRYAAQLREAAGASFEGLRIGIDCAHGSASGIAPELFRALGASEVVVLSAAPDGTNINRDSGSTHPETLQAAVVEARLDVGLAFDGDADRLIAVDERGGLVDGDAVMGVCALGLLAAGTLRNKTLVATVMSNGGLERAVTAAGGRVVRTAVGDRHVLEAMEREDAMLGGEQSGHIIFRDVAPTGDGLLTAIQLVRALRAAGGGTLSELTSRIPRLPQVMVNSRVRAPREWQLDDELPAAVTRAEAQLAGRGRILVRASGTEPKLRIMVEGDDEAEIREIASRLAALAEARLGAEGAKPSGHGG